jgi:hypothetical protein
MSNRIEFYRSRDIGERFYAAIDFLKQNWKVLYKNILIIGLPLAVIMGYLAAWQPAMIQNLGTSGFTAAGLAGAMFFVIILFFVSFLNGIYIYAMTGSVLLHYDRKQLSETTGWSELKNTFFRLAGKFILISLILILFFTIIAGIITGFAVTVSSLFGNSPVAIAFSVFLIIGGMIAILPSCILFYYPAFFSGKGIWESIQISFVLGFKNWGGLFVAIILAGIVFFILSMFFSAPYQIILLILPGQVTFLTYIFATFSTIGSLLLTPIMIIIFAFQYFSIVEKEEGVSLQSQVDEFENL